MTASFMQLAQIAQGMPFQQRVNYAMSVTAEQVYAETYTANAATAAGNAVLHIASTTGITVGSPAFNLTAASIPAGVTVLSTTATTVTLSANVVAPGVAVGDTLAFVANHGARASFATKVIQGNFNLLAATLAVLTNPTISSEAVNDPTTGTNGIPDSDIQFAVNSLWNLLAGV